MDTSTLSLLVAIFFGIIGVLIGHKQLGELFGKLRGKQPAAPSPPAPTAPPAPMVEERGNLMDRLGEKERQRFVALCRAYASKHEILDAKERQSIDEGRVLEPFVGLPNPGYTDYIISLITKEGERIAILPSGSSLPDIEGIGRTSLLIRLLGIFIPYGRLLGLSSEEIQKTPESVKLHHSRDHQWCKLIVSDTAFVGCTNGRICVVPMKGEKISFIWDVARHIFRNTEIAYVSGCHRDAGNQQKLETIFSNVALESIIKDIYVEPGAVFPVDKVIILRRSIEPNPEPPVLVKLGQDDAKRKLREALLATDLHGSNYWRRNKPLLEIRTDRILKDLDLNKMDNVYELVVAHPNAIIPYNVYDEIAELLRTGRAIRKDERVQKIRTGSGIRFHNHELISSLTDVDQIRLLATSGETLFKDASFWKELGQLQTSIGVNILLLNPASDAARKRQTEAYEPLGSDFLHEEIDQNIDTIRRMARYFAAASKKVSLECSMYQEMPPFRMTFIGKDRALVAPYIPTSRTGEGTVFYDIRHESDGALIEGFKAEYDRIHGSSTPVDLGAVDAAGTKPV